MIKYLNGILHLLSGEDPLLNDKSEIGTDVGKHPVYLDHHIILSPVGSTRKS